jgi:hypothetical protein
MNNVKERKKPEPTKLKQQPAIKPKVKTKDKKEKVRSNC